jgi:hypothetical protein
MLDTSKKLRSALQNAIHDSAHHSYGSGKNPTRSITITRQNFVGIYARWFEIFAPKEASRREWANRFVIDLRAQYKLDEATGMLAHRGVDVLPALKGRGFP